MTDFQPKGRRHIRKALVGTDKNSRHIGLWDIPAEPGSILASLEAAYLSGIEAVDRIEARKAANATSGKFTEAGAVDDARQFALENLVGPLHRARTTVAKAKAELAERRAKLTLQAPDKTDVAAALLRWEIRGYLLEMPAEQRVRYVSANLKPAIAEAILTAPPELSGIDETSFSLGALREKALEAQHPGEMEKVAELQRAVQLAERATEIGRDEVRQEIGINDPRAFNELAKPFEAKHVAPWLKKMTENGVEVVRVLDWDEIRKTGSWRKPTAEQIDAGIIAETRDEYERIRGHAA
jgi:hypothetical protein